MTLSAATTATAGGGQRRRDELSSRSCLALVLYPFVGGSLGSPERLSQVPRAATAPLPPPSKSLAAFSPPSSSLQDSTAVWRTFGMDWEPTVLLKPVED